MIHNICVTIVRARFIMTSTSRPPEYRLNSYELITNELNRDSECWTMTLNLQVNLTIPSTPDIGTLE